jgi:hypothetical protein
LSKNIQRIRGDEDRRLFVLLQNIIAGNPKDYLNSLNKDVGSVYIIDESSVSPDKDGLNRLRALFGLRGG